MGSKNLKVQDNHDSDFESEDEVTGFKNVLAVKPKTQSKSVSRSDGNDDDDDEEEEVGEEEEEEDDDDDEEDIENDVEKFKDLHNRPESKHLQADSGEEENNIHDSEENTEFHDENLNSSLEKVHRGKDKSKSKKLKNLSAKELEKEQKRIKRTGVCYISQIPPYMKPQKLRSILTRFGPVDRLFLKPEDPSAYHKRVKYGGNKKKKFTEGWIEFVSKKDAKLCAATLNGNKLGGKKTSYYYDDVMNIKYLKGFKWLDLTQQMAQENEARQARLALEISQQNKFNKTFVNNVEKAKLISNIQKKRGTSSEGSSKGEGVEEELRRNFKQRKVTSIRSDADAELKKGAAPNEKLNQVLSKVL